jgi:predicted Zn-dependent protease
VAPIRTTTVALARSHAYAEALSAFQRAYEIAPHFSVLYNIGQALIALERPTEAVAALDRYVEEGGRSSIRAGAQRSTQQSQTS